MTDLVLSGGPETLEGELLDADEATRLYEDIVRRLIDPALLRSLEGDLYEVRAFPVPAGEEREVSFTVTTPLLAEGDQAIVEVPWSRMSPRPAGARRSTSTSTCRGRSAPRWRPASTSTRSARAPGELGLGWESTSGWSPDADFRLYLGGGDGLVDTRLLAHRERRRGRLLRAPLRARRRDLTSRVARDIVLVLDRSGSMEGEKMAQAIDAAEYVLEHLGDDDRFAIVDFSRYVHTFGDELRPAADAEAGIDVRARPARRRQHQHLGRARARAGLPRRRAPGTVIFLTDGLPTVGIEEPDGILELAEAVAPERARSSSRSASATTSTPSCSTRWPASFVGSSHYVTPEERIDTEVARLYEQVSTPVLTDVEIAHRRRRHVRPRAGRASPASSRATRRCSRVATRVPARPRSP